MPEAKEEQIEAWWVGGPYDDDSIMVPANLPRVKIHVHDPAVPKSWDVNAEPAATVVVSVPVGGWRGKPRLWWAGRNPRI